MVTKVQKWGNSLGVRIPKAVAEEIHDIYDRVDLRLTHPMIYKTDLHNTWCETLARPGDRYHALLKRNWLYQWGGVLVVNAVIQALHQALEDPPENADREFLLIRSMLPGELFVGNEAEKKKACHFIAN